MDILEKVELAPRSAIFLKSGILIFNSEVPDKAGRKTRRRRTQATTKRYAFHANI